MATVFSASRDVEGLRTAALQLFEEQLREQESNAVSQRTRATNQDAVLASFNSDRTLAEGYYNWVNYLVWLKGQLSLGADVVRFQLTADEADGLRAVESAFEEFRRDHPPCPKCGSLNRAFTLRCWNCRNEMKEKR